MTDIATHFDCLVMGGGPAGSTTAALVAEAGFSTLLVEREPMPRPHVGESLMPETYWLFERLGVLDKLKTSAFAKKVGVQFVNNTGKESAPFFFRTHDDRESSESWHVNRADFDKMLFDNAQEKGCICRDKTRVLEVATEGDSIRHVKLQTPTSDNTEVTAKVVVDATGQQAVLANRFGVRKENPTLRKAAIWQHYRGAHRDASGGGVKTVIMHTEQKQSWFWYIPQADDIVSVGVVGDRDYLLKGRGTPEAIFAEEQAKCSTLSAWLEEATPSGELKVAKEFSYTTERSAGDGWVLVGDAWGFIDPVYSSGVYFALKSGTLAADCIIDGLRQNDVSATTLGRWVPDFSRQTGLIRKLVYAFYSGEFRVGKFLQEYPQHQDELVDLLIGRVFDGREGKIFADLEPWLEQNAIMAQH
ncbi:MAG: NAD(P)/FAD-dependent oxidoreductase [Planctomycetota bacterium]